MDTPGDSVTRVLHDLKAGDATAPDRLAALVYGTLHAIAERFMRQERRGHSLGATALADLAFMRLVEQRRVEWKEREQFFARGAAEMRRILIDHHRGKDRLRRRAPGRPTDAEGEGAPGPAPGPAPGAAGLDPEESARLAAALGRLAEVEPRAAEGVMLRLWGTCSEEQIAECLGVSRRTVQQDWALARAWLRRELSDEGGSSSSPPPERPG